MSSRTLHSASLAEAEGSWPAVRAAHLFDSRAEYERFHARAPWQLQVTGRGEGVVLEEWRTHLDVLAMRALWCAPGRLPQLVAQVADIAAEQGFGGVLSPLVNEEAARAYERAGMRVHQTIVVLQRDGSVLPPDACTPCAGVTLRNAVAGDVSLLASIDAECFDEFWRYDAVRLSRYLAQDHIVVAEDDRGLLGYSLAMDVRGSGTLGRLAVRPDARRRGVGTELVRDTLEYLNRSGVRTVSLCTQEDNHASRALYRKTGMVEQRGRLVFLMGPAARTGQRK